MWVRFPRPSTQLKARNQPGSCGAAGGLARRFRSQAFLHGAFAVAQTKVLLINLQRSRSPTSSRGALRGAGLHSCSGCLQLLELTPPRPLALLSPSLCLLLFWKLSMTSSLGLWLLIVTDQLPVYMYTASSVLLDSSWTPSGLLLDSSWTPSGLLLDSSWTPPGLLLDSSWTPRVGKSCSHDKCLQAVFTAQSSRFAFCLFTFPQIKQ